MIESNAIEVANVSKSFRIYHERSNTLYEHLTRIINKKRQYEDLKVLNDISFNVRKGEMIGIIGKNGEGKTTLLRLLTRIFKPDFGTIKINGSVIPLLEIGSGFQPDLTAVDNIITYGILLGFTKKQIKEKIPSILEYAELEKFADTKLKHFSAGMYARLAFSTAIQVDPDILLVDEVLSVGDVQFQEKSFQTFLSFKKRGKTIVFVSHSLHQVQKLCDRAIFLYKGRIHSIGKTNEVVNTFYKITENKIQNQSGELVNITKRCGPRGVRINSKTNRIFVASLDADIVSVIDGNDNKLIKNIEVGASPRDLAVDETTNIVYVVNRDSDSISIINAEDCKVMTSILVGERPRGIAINHDLKKVYVANRDSNSISIIDMTKNEITNNISVNSPQGIAVDKQKNMLYVALSNSNQIAVIDCKTESVISSIRVGEYPESVTFNEKTRLVYVANRYSDSVSVIDSRTNQVTILNIAVQNGPFGIDNNSITNQVFVSNSGSNTVSQIDCNTNKVLSHIPVGNFPLGIASNEITGKIYVANEASDSISVIDTNTHQTISAIKLLSSLET
jgi:YVTN family beta-propeller protein